MPAVDDKPVMQGWELTALFLVFMFITISWDALLVSLSSGIVLQLPIRWVTLWSSPLVHMPG